MSAVGGNRDVPARTVAADQAPVLPSLGNEADAGAVTVAARLLSTRRRRTPIRHRPAGTGSRRRLLQSPTRSSRSAKFVWPVVAPVRNGSINPTWESPPDPVPPKPPAWPAPPVPPVPPMPSESTPMLPSVRHRAVDLRKHESAARAFAAVHSAGAVAARASGDVAVARAARSARAGSSIDDSVAARDRPCSGHRARIRKRLDRRPAAAAEAAIATEADAGVAAETARRDIDPGTKGDCPVEAVDRRRAAVCAAAGLAVAAVGVGDDVGRSVDGYRSRPIGNDTNEVRPTPSRRTACCPSPCRRRRRPSLPRRAGDRR